MSSSNHPQSGLPQLNQNAMQSLGFALTGALVATAATAALLWIMNYLIRTESSVVADPPVLQIVEFVRLKRDEEDIRQRDPKVIKPPQVRHPAQPTGDEWPKPGVGQGGIPAIILGPGISDGAPEIALSRGYMPVTKFPAAYPRAAVERGIEGDCVVTFTVTRSGGVKDVSVVKNACSHLYFYTSSVRAAERFKYMPTIIDGEAVETVDVQTRFRYRLDDK